MKTRYVKTKFNNTINVPKIITVHYYEFDEQFNFEGESHDFWEMVYVDKGKISVISDNTSIILGQGEIIFHKPNEFHAVKAYCSSPNFFVISFECNSIAIKQFENFHTLLNKKLKPIIASIIAEAEKTYVIPKNDVNLRKLELKDTALIGGEQLVKTYLEQLCIMLLREISQKSETDIFPSKENLQNSLVEQVKSYIEKNPNKKITVSDVCHYVGYGKSMLCKTFKFYTGKGIASYANEKKIDYAKDLIRKGNMNFTEISDYLSFDNSQYFSRTFKRITGMTPSEFKSSLFINT